MPLNPLTFNTLFISEDALKAQGLINSNVDMKILTPTIKLCQEKYLTLILGTGLYVDLQNKINNLNGIGLNANETSLLDMYIQPLLVWAVQSEAPIYLSYKFLNRGVGVTADSEATKGATQKEIEMLVDKASVNRDWYAAHLIRYLVNNMNLFPAYYVTANGADVAPTVRGYNSRVYLGDGFEDIAVDSKRWYFR
jgi:hypothetical protein